MEEIKPLESGRKETIKVKFEISDIQNIVVLNSEPWCSTT
jgi:hypothetical protein